MALSSGTVVVSVTVVGDGGSVGATAIVVVDPDVVVVLATVVDVGAIDVVVAVDQTMVDVWLVAVPKSRVVLSSPVQPDRTPTNTNPQNEVVTRISTNPLCLDAVDG